MKLLSRNPVIYGTALFFGVALAIANRWTSSTVHSSAIPAPSLRTGPRASARIQVSDRVQNTNHLDSASHTTIQAIPDSDRDAHTSQKLAEQRIHHPSAPPVAALPVSSALKKRPPHSNYATDYPPHSEPASNSAVDELAPKPQMDSPVGAAITIAPAAVEKPSIPVALALSKLEIPSLSPQEQSIVENVRSSFEASIAEAPSSDPDSPEYFSYWKSAAHLHDEQLRITLGWAAYNQLSALAAQKAERERH